VPPIALGFQFKNIWDGSKTPKATPPPAAGTPHPTPLMNFKCQIVQAVHVKVAKEYESMAITLHHKALQTKAFWCTTKLMVKLVPLFSDCLPSAEQDILCHTITKQAQCIAKFEYVSNPHIDLLDKPSAALNNHPLCSIVMAYCHNRKKTFHSLD